MALRDRAAAQEETSGEPAQGEHFKGPALDRQSAGLSDRSGAPLKHRNVHFCQSKLTGDPQPNGTRADYQDIKIIAQDLILHISATELRWLGAVSLGYLDSKRSQTMARLDHK
jgi:hypothetical protein